MADWYPPAKQDVGNTDCWLWSGYIQSNGYGRVTVNGSGLLAHRWVWELTEGPIPSGLELDHLCRVRHCVNPAHLEPVSHRENVLRGTGFAAKHAAATHCPQGHPYEGPNLHIRPSGRRHCKTCHAAREARRRAARTPDQRAEARAYQREYMRRYRSG